VSELSNQKHNPKAASDDDEDSEDDEGEDKNGDEAEIPPLMR